MAFHWRNGFRAACSGGHALCMSLYFVASWRLGASNKSWKLRLGVAGGWGLLAWYIRRGIRTAGGIFRQRQWFGFLRTAVARTRHTRLSPLIIGHEARRSGGYAAISAHLTPGEKTSMVLQYLDLFRRVHEISSAFYSRPRSLGRQTYHRSSGFAHLPVSMAVCLAPAHMLDGQVHRGLKDPVKLV